MSVELDHVFICSEVGAPGADRLVAFGLAEGTPNVHPGQGTANRRCFFHDAMLELVWVHDGREARSPPFPPRTSGSGGCTAAPDTRLTASAHVRRTRGALSPGDRLRWLSRRRSGARPTCCWGRASTSPQGRPQASRWCSLLRLAEGRMAYPRGAANRSSIPRGSSRSRGCASRSPEASLSPALCARYRGQAFSRSRRATNI